MINSFLKNLLIPINGGIKMKGIKMKKSLSIILNLILILSFVALGYAVEEYEFVSKWTPNSSPRSIALDSEENIYIAGNQRVEKYTSNGTFLFSIENQKNNDDYNMSSWEMYVAIDSSGNIYISSRQDHKIFKFDSGGTFITKWGSQGDGEGQFNSPEGIALDSDGNVYVCDSMNHRIVKFDSDGTFIAAFGTAGGENGQFQSPAAIALDDSNNIYITEIWNCRVQVLTSDGTFITKWGEWGEEDGQFNEPRGIALDFDGNVYVTDTQNNRITKFSSDGTFITKWGSYGDDNYHFDGLTDVAIDYTGNVFVTDCQNGNWDNRRIMKYRRVGIPTIDITNPADSEFLTGSVTIQATVTVPDGFTLSNVEFYKDDTKLGEDTADPFELAWDTTAETNGAYIIWVIATNNEGAKSKEKISVVVANGDAAPTVSITDPVDLEEVRGTVTVTAGASDDLGIDKVEFYIQGILMSTDEASPYEFSWDTTGEDDGECEVKVIAYDTIGQFTEDTINVTVGNIEEYGYISKWLSDNPRSIALDNDGYLYVAGGHWVLKYSPTGELISRIEDFETQDFMLSWNMNVAIDSSGYIYVTSQENNNIIKFDSDGNYVTKWGSMGTGNSEFNSPEGVAVDSEGNVYVCDSMNHRISIFDSEGTFIATWGSEGSGNGQFSNPMDIAIDSSGNIYVTEGWNHRVQVLDSEGTFVRMWGNWGIENDQMRDPRGITIDSEDNVYVADSQNHRIMKYSSEGTFIAKWGTQGTGDLQFDNPHDVAVDSSGNVYVADMWNNRIMKFRSTWLPTIEITNPVDYAILSDTVLIQATADSAIGISKVEFYLNDTLSSTDTSSPFEYSWDTTSSSDGTYIIKAIAYNTESKTIEAEITVIVNNTGDAVPTVSITSPADGATVQGDVTIEVDATDDVGIDKVEFFVDGILLGEDLESPYEYIWSTRSLKDGDFSIEAAAYDTLGQKEEASITVTVSNGEEFGYLTGWVADNPRGIAVDNKGYVYTAGQNRIIKFTTSGTYVFMIESQGMQEFMLSWSMRIAVDSSGNIYVSNQDNNEIIKFDSVGNYLTKWGSFGSADDQFNWPQGLTVDSEGNIYVADEQNHRIVKYDSEGNYLAKFGSWQGQADGQFSNPQDVAVDSSGNIFVVDSGNNRIQVLASDGTFLRAWGSWGQDDFQFDWPRGIALDPDGYVYIADSNNHRIVKYSPEGEFIAKWGSMGSSDLQFHNPTDVAVDSDFYVYVADSDNNRVMKYRSTWLPTVEITSPENKAVVSGTVTIKAGADSGIGISKVEFFINGTSVGEDTSFPYEYEWDTTAESDGTYTITAVASNGEGQTKEHEITLVVNNSEDEVPTVSITDPEEESKVLGTVTLKAEASDDKGIDKVEFYVMDELLGTDEESPYEYSWDTRVLEDGECEISAVAYDTIGQSTETSITVIVKNEEEFEFLANWSADNPKGIDVDKDGFIYVSGGHRILKYAPDGTPVANIEDWQSEEFWFSWNMHIAVDNSGNIYASCEENNEIIKFDSNGTYLLKWGSFGSGDNQFNGPQGLTVDSEGNVYVCDAWNNRVLKFDSNGNYLFKWGTWQGWEEGQFTDPRDVAVDSSGNIYVVDSGNGRIQVLGPDGTFIRAWGTWGQEDYQFDWAQGIGIDSEGNVYVADTNNNRIQKYSSEGEFLSKWGTMGSGDYQFNFPGDVAVDSDFNVYVADTNNNRIVKFRSTWLPTIEIITPGDKTTVLDTVTIHVEAESAVGISKVEFLIDGVIVGEDTSSPFEYEWDTTTYSDGPHTIKAVAYTSGDQSVEAEITAVVNNSGDEAPTVSITSPSDGAVVRSEVLIEAEASDDNGIEKVEFYIDNKLLGSVTESPYEYTWDTLMEWEGDKVVEVRAYDTLGQSTAASITVRVLNTEKYEFAIAWKTEEYGRPWGIAVDNYDNVYVTFWERIVKYTPMGSYLSEIGNEGSEEVYRLSGNMRIAVDDSGKIYVSVRDNNEVIVFDSDGNYLDSGGNKGEEDENLNCPEGIAIDSQGNWYIADSENHRVIKLGPDGSFISTWGEQGFEDGNFQHLQDIAIDDEDNIYVLDSGNNRIQVFDTEGTFLRKWGEWGQEDHQFQWAMGIAVDSEGCIYIVDTENCKVVKFSPEGMLLARWGNRGYGDYLFENPTDIAVNSSGHVYIVDEGNQRIVKFKTGGAASVEITNPIEEDTIMDTVTIQATAESDFGISKVEFFIDGESLGEDTTSPYEYEWDTTLSLNGSHEIKAVAYNVDGNTAVDTISVLVNNGGDEAPQVSITYPADGAVIRGTKSIIADASDDLGIDKIEFYVEGTLLETDMSSPYTYTWDTSTVVDGYREVKAIAYDTIGQKTWDSITVIIDNANNIFSIDFTGATVIFVNSDSKLRKIDLNGNISEVISSDPDVSQFQFSPARELYVFFKHPLQLLDNNSYLLVKVDPTTNEYKGIDKDLSSLEWNTQSVSPNLQFDGLGNIYYLAKDYEGKLILRKYTDENNIEDLINENITIHHWHVTEDGTIIMGGVTESTSQRWLRKLNPDNSLENLAEPSEVGWIAQFPDDRVYVGMRISSSGWDHGVYKLSADLGRIDSEAEKTPYIGHSGEDYTPLYDANQLAEGHSQDYCQGFTDSAGAYMLNYEVDDSTNNVYGLMASWWDEYRTVVKLYPEPEVIEPQLIERVTLMEETMGQLVMAGLKEGVNKLVLYSVLTGFEINLMYSNIEIYHLDVLSNGNILFDGLNFADNTYVVGMFEVAAGASPSGGIRALTYGGYTELAQLGGKPASFGVLEGTGEAAGVAVEIASPSDEAHVKGTVRIKAVAIAQTGVTKVEFYVDDELKETDSTSPYVYQWDTTTFTEGIHTIKVTAYDVEEKTAEDEVTVTVNNSTSPGEIDISESELYFGAAAGGGSTGSQVITIDHTGGLALSWTATPSENWLQVTPTSGTGAEKITVSVTTTGLSEGIHTGTITIADLNATNSPQTINVTLEIYGSASIQAPFGSIDTPINGTTGVAGAIPVSGWALDDLEVTRIIVWREAVGSEETSDNGLVYIGDAIQVEGARPDVEEDYPEYPLNYKAAWGYMLLTNYLPNQGNGTYTIRVVAEDREGNSSELGTTTITCDNTSDIKPFGTIDTPTQGGEASGSDFINFGWALTPQPNYIPDDGSTITALIDGEEAGNPVYNQYRSDVAGLFTGYANSDGAVGYFYINTTEYINGEHTIAWSVEDSAGSTAGIGTRYFTILNTQAAGFLQSGMKGRRVEHHTPYSLESMYSLPSSFEPVKILRGFKRHSRPETVLVDNLGIVNIEIREVERVAVDLGKGIDYKGYMIVGKELRPLPIGSTLNMQKGIFFWLPGPGFIGEYNLVFLVQDETGLKRRINTKIKILPKFSIF